MTFDTDYGMSYIYPYLNYGTALPYRYNSMSYPYQIYVGTARILFDNGKLFDNNEMIYTNPLLNSNRTSSVSSWIEYYANKILSDTAGSNVSQTVNPERYVTKPKINTKKNQRKSQKRNTGSKEVTIKKSGRTVTLSKAFVDKVKDIAKKINLKDYNDLLAVINAESGFSTTARSGGNPNGAVGLIQFTDIAIKDLNQAYGLNLTKNKIAKMSAMEQLDLVEKYLVRSKSYRFAENEKLSASDLYAIVYMPARAKNDIVATTKDGDNYTKNIGLDRNRDGKITYAELGQRLNDFSVNVNLVA